MPKNTGHGSRRQIETAHTVEVYGGAHGWVHHCTACGYGGAHGWVHHCTACGYIGADAPPLPCLGGRGNDLSPIPRHPEEPGLLIKRCGICAAIGHTSDEHDVTTPSAGGES